MLNFSVQEAILFLVPGLLGLTLHEFMHAYVALRCGDPTALHQGRVTLNPLAHLDLWGTLLLAFVGFGWAKPVPVNRANFRNPGRDDILVSFAGPLANVVLAAAFCLTLRLAAMGVDPESMSTEAAALLALALMGAFVNFMLGLFNLVPIAPLDGHHIVRELLPHAARKHYMALNRFGPIILIALFLFGGAVFRWITMPAMWLTGWFAGSEGMRVGFAALEQLTGS